MAGTVRVYFKKQIILNRLTFRQQDMLKLGTVGVASVVNRVRLGRGPEDGPAKPLRQSYARFKSRKGLIPRRDLYGTGMARGNQLTRATKRLKTGLRFIGHMLDFFAVRVVGENFAKADISQYAARQKGLANQQREPWAVLSPKNRAAVREAARRILIEAKPRMILEKFLGGNAA